MGSCFGTPVNNYQSPGSTNTKPSNISPGETRKISKFQNGPTNSPLPTPTNNNKFGNDLVQTISRRIRVHDREIANSSTIATSSGTNGSIVTPTNLKIFTIAELKSATRNFRPDSVLGEGGFGRVFKGWVDEKTYAPSRAGLGMPVAVKRSNPDSAQGLEEWQAEVRFLGKFCHPNLVKLLGFCWEERQFLLVYEHMQKGSLENHLFRKGAEPIPWETRIKIAIGAAKGLAFLHNSEKSVIYRDFKASNILLDGEFNAKLSDFGLAKFGPINGNSHVTTRVMGTRGYAAPEYVSTGHLYVKSDVYGFGVVLLEMLTGLMALDHNRPSGKFSLVEWAKPSLQSNKRKLRKIMDPRLEGQYPIKGAMQAAELILQCLETDPKNRPSMDQILVTLECINGLKEKPKEPNNEVSTSSGVNDHASTSKDHHHPTHNDNHRHRHRSPVNPEHGGGSSNGYRPHVSSRR